MSWLADFRDPWSKWDILEKLNTSALAMYLHRQLESSVLNEADKVTTVSDRLAKSLGGVEVLHNGYSPSDPFQNEPDPNSFTIGYFGLLNELRNPSRLWMMLDQMCRENAEFASKLKIRIGGNVAMSIRDELSRFHELVDCVEYLGYLSHEEVIQEYKKCNLLLLLLNKSTNAQWILPVKFFEYLGANRMILGLGPKDSDLGDLMSGSDVGELLQYSDIQNMRIFIEDVYENDRYPTEADITRLLERFSHKNLVTILDRILQSIN